MLVLHPGHVAAQDFTVDILVDGDFSGSAAFLSLLEEQLDPEAREAVRFEPDSVGGEALAGALTNAQWSVAIVSSAALARLTNETVATALEIPFIWTDPQRVIAFQESALGRAGLGDIPEQDITALTYINAGVTYLVGRMAPKGPADLAGARIGFAAVDSDPELTQLGISSVLLSPDEMSMALMAGSVDALAVESARRDSQDLLPEGGYLLENSVRGNVAVLLVKDTLWRRLPFVYRAMISDAALGAARMMERRVLAADAEFRRRSQALGMEIVRFSDEDARRSADGWIAEQPEQRRSLLNDALSDWSGHAPRRPALPGPNNRTSLGAVYFATTRADNGHARLRYRFGDARTNVISCSKVVNSSSGLSLADPVLSGTSECARYLAAAMDARPKAFVFVHGFMNHFQDALENATILATAAGDDVTTVLWSWPSYHEGLGFNYEYDKESATGIASTMLQRLLTALHGSSSTPLSLLAHSMGGWHVVNVIQGLNNAGSAVRLGNLVMAAPDVPADEFGFGVPAMSGHADLLTLYASDGDLALNISKSRNRYPRAGTGGAASILVMQDVESIDVDGRLFSSNHSYVYEAGKVRADLSSILQTNLNAAGRGLVRHSKQSHYYWKFP